MSKIIKFFKKIIRTLYERIYRSKVFFAPNEKKRADSDNGRYIRFVKKANRNYKAFLNFKSHPDYRTVLEHVSYSEGKKYLEIIQEESPDFIERISEFKINDEVGGPVTFEYPEIGEISPTTLRYIKVASDIRKLFGDLNGATVAEIGVGYGGQMLILDRVYEFYRYDLFDLPPVLSLTTRYLESHILDSSYRTLTLNQTAGEKNYDLVISNYAFSEFPSVLQEKYIEKILLKSEKGYLMMNSGKDEGCNPDKLSLSELEKMLPPFEVLKEQPLTGPNNYIICWGME